MADAPQQQLPNSSGGGTPANFAAPNTSVNAGGQSNGTSVVAGNSPWSEEIDIPEEAPTPRVVGTLPTQPPKPAPFKMPDNVEEKVGQKVSAANYTKPAGQQPNAAPVQPSQQAAPTQATKSPSMNFDFFDNIGVDSMVSNPAPAPVPAPSPTPAPIKNVNLANAEVGPQGGVRPQLNSAVPNREISSQFSAPRSQNPTTTALSNQRGSSGPGNPPGRPGNPLISNVLNNGKPGTAVAQQPATKGGKHSDGNYLFKGAIGFVSLILIFGIVTALTEAGLLSVGAEKIYGAIGVENLWAGLTNDAGQSLALSMLQMQNHPQFQVQGKMSIMVDGSMDSEITNPLVSLSGNKSYAKIDQNVGSKTEGILTQSVSDSYDTSASSTSSSNSTSNSSSNISSNTSANSTVSNQSTNSSDNSSSNSNSNDSSNSASVTGDGVNPSAGSDTVHDKIVQLDTTVAAKTTESAAEAVINLNDTQKSTINLVSNNGNLFVKSSGAINYGSSKSDLGKWISFKTSSTQGKSVSKDFFKISATSGASVKGTRVGNEKVGGVRCFDYQIDEMEIGNSLAPMGITSDMVQTIAGNVWIGIKDKLIRRVSLRITTPVSSSVRLITLDVTFGNYDTNNEISVVDPSATVEGGKEAVALTGDAKRKDDLSKILAALNKYKEDHQTYPVSSDLLKMTSNDNIISKALVPSYLSEMLFDPNAAQGWYYSYQSDGYQVSLSAKLEDANDTEGQLIGGKRLYFLNSN